jgi:hypothetical protein
LQPFGPELLSSCLLSKNVEIRIDYNFVPVVLCGCETWSLTLREEVFGPKRDEMPGGWQKLHNKDLHDLYSLHSIFRVAEGHVV